MIFLLKLFFFLWLNYILITEGTWGKQGVTYENDAVADRFGPPVTRSQTSAAKK